MRVPDRASADERLLTYTSAPLTVDTEVTGDPVMHVFLDPTGRDAQLCQVGLGYMRSEAMPLVPGTPVELVVELFPTSYLFRAGHSIRIALSGTDVDHFSRAPEEGDVLQILRGAERPSRIELPLLAR